jgi:predicted amidophosphoribosyltransferase
MTTGSTANEAAQAMLLAGAERVDVLVLSVTRMQMLENG